MRRLVAVALVLDFGTAATVLSRLHADGPGGLMYTVVGSAFPWGKAGERWGELVRQRTGGRINIKMYPGVSLVAGDQTREFTAIRQGVIDLAIGSTINWSPQIRELNLFSLPFLMPDYAAIDALTQGEVGKDIFRRLERAGVVPLAWGENGFREVTHSKRELRRPEDFKGRGAVRCGVVPRILGNPLAGLGDFLPEHLGGVVHLLPFGGGNGRQFELVARRAELAVTGDRRWLLFLAPEDHPEPRGCRCPRGVLRSTPTARPARRRGSPRSGPTPPPAPDAPVPAPCRGCTTSP